MIDTIKYEKKQAIRPLKSGSIPLSASDGVYQIFKNTKPMQFLIKDNYYLIHYMRITVLLKSDWIIM